MSEADRVFARLSKRGSSSSETRQVVTVPRRNRSGTTASRIVEVVHVARRTSRLPADHSRTRLDDAGAETWRDGLPAKRPSAVPAPAPQPSASEFTPPIVHVMPAWEPSTRQPIAVDDKPAELPSSTMATKHLDQRDAETVTPTVTARRFADPFAGDDDGANCIRCGYLVERARDARGLWTCASCG
jgi:hypothetical protein